MTDSSDDYWLYEDDNDYAPVPTKSEARLWAARRLARTQFSWDTIAECFHPEGLILSQDGCDAIVDQLYSCTVVCVWPDGESITFTPEER